MPAILTHDFFGRDAYGDVSSLLGFDSFDQHDAFLLGNQGPDPLFYLVANPRIDQSMRVGGLLHHERPARLLVALRDALSMLSDKDRPIGEAYAAGFLCHYLLDSAEHPLVFSTQYALCDAGVDGLDRSNGSLVHAEIERDLDEMVLFEKTGLTVHDYRPYQEVLAASDAALSVVDTLYFHMVLWTYGLALDASIYSHAVKLFRAVQQLFWSPAGVNRRLIGSLERRLTGAPYSLYCAMSHRARAERTSAFDNHEHRPWANPFSYAISTESFWDLYEDALARTFDAQRAFFADSFGLAEATALTGGLNFSGEAVDPDAPVGSLEDDDT